MLAEESFSLIAPLSGPVLPLEDVPDEVFRSRMVGDGVAIDPINETLYAPLAGEVVQIHPAHHALTLKSAGGTHILMHVGIDTVALKGHGFTPLVKEGQTVECGQPLLRFDADYVASHARSLISVVLVIDHAVPFEIAPAHLEIVEARSSKLFDVKFVSHASPEAQDSPSKEMIMTSKPLVVTSKGGLHARPAALLTSLAKRYTIPIYIKKADRVANARSLVSIMGLEIAENDVVQITASGADAPKVVAEIRDLLQQALAAPEVNSETAPPAAPPEQVESRQRLSSPENGFLGVSASPGLAFGRVYQLRETSFQITKLGRGVSSEKTLLKEAMTKADLELADLRKNLVSQGSISQASIFAAHRELLEDPELFETTIEGIQKGESAAYAWHQSFEQQAQRLAQLNNELLAARANDLRDVGQRVLRNLLGCNSLDTTQLQSDTILIADNLTPSDTASLDREKIRGFCTLSGGATSHVAILARSLGIPAVAAIDPGVLELKNGTEVVINGSEGFVLAHPTREDKLSALAYQSMMAERREEELAHAHEPANTRDGKWIEVAANIGGVSDAEEAVRNGCDGVGLLRSEFLFLERDTAPDEEEQLAVYQRISDLLGERPFTVRTLDVGGDKPLKYLPIDAEENPFLGLRGIRVGLKYQNVLRTQLRALLQVRHKGEMRIMFPMIATLKDWQQARQILEEERGKLQAPAVKVGIMVEVPSTALLAEIFAREVDFFSIGTNDLTQYTLAIDRGNNTLAGQFDTLHPSVFKLIEMTTKAARAHKKWVGVCGGIAGDEDAVPALIGLGVDELSVSVPSLAAIKNQVRKLETDSCQRLAKQVVAATSGSEIKRLNKSFAQTNPRQIEEIL